MFRLGFRRMMEPLAEYIEQRLPREVVVRRTVVRPPGALAEGDFLDTCYRCGNCVDICPVHAIRQMTREDVERAGTPYVDADLAACIACEEIACTKACPSGALQQLENIDQIAMGLAVVDTYLCLRHNGDECTTCIAQCPVGEKALHLNDRGEVEVEPAGCIGCGVCQYRCPSLPRAVQIMPS